MPGPARSRTRRLEPSREYTVRDGKGRLRLAPLPIVALSFEEGDESVFFTQRAIHSDAFSNVFRHTFDVQKANLVTPFLRRVQTGWDGPRVIPVRFARGRLSCVRRSATEDVDPREVMTELLGLAHAVRRTARARVLEADAMNRMIETPLSLLERDVVLTHWVADWPHAWSAVRVLDSFDVPQWLDTHSHPAWYYPHAAVADGHAVLLHIRCARGTPALRLKRHSSYMYRVNLLRSGEWTHTEAEPTETEVRLPPGRYLVTMPPTMERFADRKVLLVTLVYEPRQYPNCRSWWRRRPATAV